MMLNVLALFLCSLIPLGCSTGSGRSISQSDIPDIIGEWEGSYNASGSPQRITVQILNDSLEGNISFSSSMPKAFNGKIENGRFVASWETNCWINMKFRKEEMKLEGSIQSPEIRAALTLTKIK